MTTQQILEFLHAADELATAVGQLCLVQNKLRESDGRLAYDIVNFELGDIAVGLHQLVHNAAQEIEAHKRKAS
jgi:hypothetical protein